MNRAYALGKLLRSRYDTFLGETKFDDFYARSTNTDRTKMSLQLVLAGVHPGNNRSTWNPNFTWEPVPIVYVDQKLDFLRTFDCPK